MPILLAAGGTEEQVAALAADDAECPCFTEQQRPILRFTTEVVRDAAPGEATWAAISAHHSPREIIELLLVIGQYMMLGRIMATTGIDIDGPFGTEVAQGAARTRSS